MPNKETRKNMYINNIIGIKHAEVGVETFKNHFSYIIG